jgi:hypothetical protein
MNVLTLDLGTHLGWARKFGEVRESGTELLAKTKEIRADRERGLDRNGDVRYYRLLAFLMRQIHEAPGGVIHRVVYEDVQFTTFTLQTQLWSSLRTAIWTIFPPGRQTIVTGMPVGSLKKFGAKHGGATKEMMAAALLKRHPELFCKPERVTASRLLVTKTGRDVDDNEVDACHLLDWAIQTFRQ